MTQRNEVISYFREHLHDATDECMIWPYATNGKGYGKVWFDGRVQLVAVLACIAHHGPRPEGTVAAHGPCHDTLCWNGAHMSWKTWGQNQEDRLRDGTARLGEASVTAKLTEADVRAIRSRYAGGAVTQRALAAEYGVNQTRISSVVRRHTWKHV